MILLDHVVQVLTAADPDWVLPTEIEFVAHSHAAQRGVRRLETVKRDGAGLTMALQRLAEERFGGGHVPRPAEMRFDRAAAFVHRPVEVHPAAANLDIRFIAAPGAPDRSREMRQQLARSVEYRITQRRIVQGATLTPN